MKQYEIVYYDDKGNMTEKETGNFVIHEVDISRQIMRFCVQYTNNKRYAIDHDNDWSKYIKCGCEKFISEEEMFILCL